MLNFFIDAQLLTCTTYKDSDTPQVTTWIYNNRGNLASKKYPNNNGPSYTYNADGNLLTITWERNIITSYTYDNAGRLLTQSYSDNTPGITATYDYLDRIVSLTDASGTRNFTYNAQHLLVNETIPHIMNLHSSFTYDNFGRRTSRTLQKDNTTVSTAGRSYDTFGRIASVSNGTDTLSYTYRPGGQLSLSGWTNGQDSAMSNQSYEYDQYNRLTGIKLNNVNEVSYTLNAKDQRTAATYANAGLWNFTYDDKGQVTGANGSSKSYTYSYDGIGNRLTANENSTITNYTSNLLNQYTLINSAVPNYDADGNMTASGNGWTYTYNGENRIVQASNGGTTVTMAYDYAGRRISKTVSESGVVQNSYKYVYDGFKLIAVYNNNDLVMTFTWQPESLGMDVPISMTYGGATYYYVTDGNKNVTALLDATGNRVAEYVYGPFGQTVSATGSMAQINPFRFSSEFHDDETGLVYYNYRYYSTELGRWTKRDPIEEDGGSNLYIISNNNIIISWDKNGNNPYSDPYLDPYSDPYSGVYPNSDSQVQNPVWERHIEFLPKIPSIARNKGWNELANLFAVWFSGSAHIISDGKKVPLDAPYNDNIIKIAWVKNHSEDAISAFKKLSSPNMFKTSKVKEEYVKLFENVTNEQFNHISIKDPRVRHSKHVQTVSVEGSKLGKLTPVDAALYNFSLHAVMQGCVLTAKEKKILKIEKIGIYVKDVFNFSGEQYLGFWKEPDTVARWGILGYNVSNKHFREYRKRNHVGKDFFVFSDVEVVTFPKVLEVKF